MRFSRWFVLTVARVGMPLLELLVLVPLVPASASGPEDTFIVVYGLPTQVDRHQVAAAGHTITGDLGEAGVLVARSSDPAALARLPGVTGACTGCAGHGPRGGHDGLRDRYGRVPPPVGP
jgi:hypothetical protein